jgi:adenosylcobinamide-GDP ribazoletransferase
MVLMMALLPNARGEGLSHATGRPAQSTALVALGLATGIAAILVGWTALPMLAAALAMGVLISVVALRRIGGQTGDVLGASQQLAEAGCLAVLSARL